MPGNEAVIIGGGLAGLTCAVGLADHGVRVTVLERAGLLGGRAGSWRDDTTGDSVSIGPHILLNQYHNMLRLLDRLGTRDQVIWQADNRFLTMVDGRREIVIRNSGLLPPYHFVPGLLSDPAIGLRDFISNWPVVKLALESDEETLLDLDDRNARDFLRDLGVSERFISRFWNFAAFAILNVPLEEASAAALLRFYRRLIGYRDLAIGFPKAGLGELYAPQARELIENAGGRVIVEAKVKKLLSAKDERVTGVELADGRRIMADFCVAALPPPSLNAIIPQAWRTRPGVFADLALFQPVSYLSVYLWFDRKLTDRQFWARAYSAADLNCDFYDLSNINPDWRTRASLIASNIIHSQRATALSDAEIIRLTLRELAEFLPEAGQARVLHATVHRIPLAIPAPVPGSERRRPEVRTPVQGLFIAGDWVQTHLPYSMESAVAAGWLAAEQILHDLGRPQSLAAALPVLPVQPGWLRWVGRLWPDRSLPASLKR